MANPKHYMSYAEVRKLVRRLSSSTSEIHRAAGRILFRDWQRISTHPAMVAQVRELARVA